jgi:hypothetical protein
MIAVAETPSPADLRKLTVKLEKEAARRASENKLANFTAYKKQREFFAAGRKHRERLLMAANRFGKTECGAAEMSYHLTGRYPPGWPGKRFHKPVRAWAAGVTSETTRDVVQAKLIGPPFNGSEWGQGMVPKSCIADIAPARGIPAAIDTVSRSISLHPRKPRGHVSVMSSTKKLPGSHGARPFLSPGRFDYFFRDQINQMAQCSHAPYRGLYSQRFPTRPACRVISLRWNIGFVFPGADCRRRAVEFAQTRTRAAQGRGVGCAGAGGLHGAHR